MAAALIGGMANTLLPGANIHVVDPNPEKTGGTLHQRFDVTTAERIEASVSQCDVVVLAVKTAADT